MPISTLQSGSFPSNVAIDTDTLVVDGANNRVGVGTTSAPATLISATSGGGIALDPNSFSAWNREATSSNHSHLVLNQTGVDAQYLQFRKDGATVGSIGTNENTDLFIAGGDTGLLFNDDVDFISPATATGAGRDNAVDLGYSTVRFKNLYLSGGVLLGGTGSGNYLNDYEEGGWTPQLWKGSTQVTSPTAVYGLYRKIGSVFLVSFYFYKSSGSNTDTGEWQIRGFPFAIVSSSSAAYMSLAAGYTGINSTNYFNQAGSHRWQANGTTFLSLYGPQSGTQWTSGHVELAASGFLVTS